MRVVGIDFGVGDDTVPADDVSTRHRKRPATLAIDGRQIISEGLVDFDHLGLQRVAKPKCGGDGTPLIDQDRKPQLVFA